MVLLQQPQNFERAPQCGADWSPTQVFQRIGGLIMTIGRSTSSEQTTPEDVRAIDDLRTLIADQLGVSIERVSDEARFTDDLGADWLDRLELMIVIEDQFAGVEMTHGDVDQIETVGDLTRHIENVDNERRRRGATPVNRKLFGPRLARALKPAKQQEGREQGAFFLRLANDAMRSLICRCLSTQHPVDLQLYADHATPARIRFNSVRFQCPHCGLEHETNVAEAWLEDTLVLESHQTKRTRHQHGAPTMPLADDLCPERFYWRDRTSADLSITARKITLFSKLMSAPNFRPKRD